MLGNLELRHQILMYTLKQHMTDIAEFMSRQRRIRH